MKIGVLVATYNGEKYIQRQLESIINQSIKVDEIIISDDESSDGTVDIINEIISNTKHIEIKLVVNRKIHGVVENFENAFNHSTADFLFFSDQDDVWKPDKVERFVDAADKYPECELFFSNATITNQKLEPTGKTVWDYYWYIGKENPLFCVLDTEDTVERIAHANFITGMCMAIKRSCFYSAFPIPHNMVHDDMLACWCALNSKLLAINEETAYYRQHNNNVIGVDGNPFVPEDRRRNTIKGLILNSDQNMAIINFLFYRFKTLVKYDSKGNHLKIQKQYAFFNKLRNIAQKNKLTGTIMLFFLVITGKYLGGYFSRWFRRFLLDFAMILFVSTRKRKDYFSTHTYEVE